MSREPNVVYVGRKPVMNYVLAVITAFSTGIKEVKLMARGRAISTAIDVAEITRRRLMEEVKVSKIDIGTEVIPVKEGGTRSVSTIEIVLTVE